MDLVKRCPTCGAENTPTAVRCACSAFLIGIDLTERALALAAQSKSAEAIPKQVQASCAVAGTGAVTRDASAQVCSFADCAQPNPLGTAVCVYCNRPMVSVAAPARRTLIQLPAALAKRFAIDEPLQAAGGEADLFVVRDNSSGQRAVLKLYRLGIEPNTEVLERVSRAAPDQLVHLLEHGRDEGVPYELLEYCEHGSLRSLLKGRPVPSDATRTLLIELADAIEHLHACGIVHRDLKPENVLIRGLLPLDLVLTDFGIASLAQATMHYTSAARTLRYSPPEAGSNWVGEPTDYWALGMILVEALSGRHPFDGLSDNVIAHWLVTRPIDVSGVQGARWQQLCRGLLVRDPKLRWGAQEIERWLGGDQLLLVAAQDDAPDAGLASPYRVGERECRTPRELAVALAADWSAGVKDLKRGMLRAWLQNDLRDQNLARAAADAEEALELSDDERLLRLLLRLDPALPPVFKGYDISLPGLAALTRKALEDHNEERQSVVEIIERRILDLFAGSPLQEVRARFEQAKDEFERALERAFAAGAPRTLAPEGCEWQLRMLLFVIEPPKGLIENLRASAQRLGGGAAQRCDWYRALGDAASASPSALAAMVLLGPSAAQLGMELERESARRTLSALAMVIDSNERLRADHAEGRARLIAALDESQDEEAILALPELVGALAQGVERSFDMLWHEAVIEARTVTAPARLAEVRRRIDEWASWRAGVAWEKFGQQIELRSVSERRTYRLQLASQIEARRIPYEYSASDSARLPAQAKATLDDVWACDMPALPEFAADLKLSKAQELRCPRCHASGRVELQEAWGSTAYPFASTFACHDKVGVQCQTRLTWANDHLPAAHVPAVVADFVEAHARQDDAPEHRLELTAARIPAPWIARQPAGRVRDAVAAKLAGLESDVKPGERMSAQRLRIVWTGLAEVCYLYQGKDYVIWIPQRTDSLPIALEHPLPSQSEAASANPADDPVPVAELESGSQKNGQGETEANTVASDTRLPAASAPRWLRMLAWGGGIALLAACLLTWIVHWKH